MRQADGTEAVLQSAKLSVLVADLARDWRLALRRSKALRLRPLKTGDNDLNPTVLGSSLKEFSGYKSNVGHQHDQTEFQHA